MNQARKEISLTNPEIKTQKKNAAWKLPPAQAVDVLVILMQSAKR